MYFIKICLISTLYFTQIFFTFFKKNHVGGAGAADEESLWINKASFFTNNFAPFFIRRDIGCYNHGSKTSNIYYPALIFNVVPSLQTAPLTLGSELYILSKSKIRLPPLIIASPLTCN